MMRQVFLGACAAAAGVSLAFALGPAGAHIAGTTTEPIPLPTVADQPSSTVVRDEPNEVEVRFKAGVTARQIDLLLAHDGVHSVLSVPDIAARLVRVKPGRIAEVRKLLARSPLVATVELDEDMEELGAPNDADYPDEWGLRLAQFPRAWTLAGRRSVLVAVVDSGVDASVADLAGRVVGSIDVTKDPSPKLDGHGTAVAGIIGARNNNGQGGAGACPVCRILSVRVLDSKGQGDAARTAEGIVVAADRHARVINVSVGGAAPFDALEAAVEYATKKGALVVAAAGNAGSAVPFWPARYANALSVGASTADDALYAWSQRGGWVEVSAPGCNVAPKVRSGYEDFCGTSSAAPLVSAAAALMFAARPTATPQQVVRAILATSRRPVANLAYGRIDAARAVASIRR